MINLTIPGYENFLCIATLILDLNGTLVVGGKLVDGVGPKIAAIQSQGVRVLLFSGDTRGVAQSIADQLGIQYTYAPTQDAKMQEATALDPTTCASIGNGLIDKKMMEVVSLSILTLQGEGIHRETMMVSDIIVPNILDALDLFIDHDRLIATLRK